MQHDREADDKGLPGLDAIDAGVYVDGVGAEHRQHQHVDVVQRPEVDRKSEISAQEGRDDDGGRTAVDL